MAFLSPSLDPSEHIFAILAQVLAVALPQPGSLLSRPGSGPLCDPGSGPPVEQSQVALYAEICLV